MIRLPLFLGIYWIKNRRRRGYQRNLKPGPKIEVFISIFISMGQSVNILSEQSLFDMNGLFCRKLGVKLKTMSQFLSVRLHMEYGLNSSGVEG